MSKRKIDLSGAQVTASVLATLTAAIVTSKLGSAPALIVAAAVSIISTAGTAIYRYYLSRTGEKLRSAAPVVLRRANTRGAAGAGPDPGASAHPAATHDRDAAETRPTSGQGREWWEGGPDAATEAIPAPSQGSGGHKGSAQAANGRQRPRWLMLAVTATTIFAIVIVGVAAYKIVTHRSMTAHGLVTPVSPARATSPAPATASPQPSNTSVGGQQSVTPTPSGSATASPSASPSPSPSPSPVRSQFGSQSPSPSSASPAFTP